jgi:hypothetical protein
MREIDAHVNTQTEESSKSSEKENKLDSFEDEQMEPHSSKQTD